MNYTDHTTAVTARLVAMIQTGSHGQWAMPWHTHDLASRTASRPRGVGVDDPASAPCCRIDRTSSEEAPEVVVHAARG